MKTILAFFVAFVLTGSATCHAYLIAPFPGLDQAIGKAHTIAIIRIDQEVDDDPINGICRMKCMIYQCLKGDLKPDTWVTLRLMNCRSGGFVSPFQRWSTHLVFLSKEGDSYQNFNFEGSHLGLSPLGNEKMPEGKTLRDKIRTLMDRAIAHREQQAKREADFLKKVRE